jgi:hypothetical protein
MTSEVAIPTSNTPAEQVQPQQELVPFGAETSELVLWAYEARQAARVAASLAKTSFVPLSLRNKPEDITAAILAGQELGMKPMATLRSIDVIQGTPALRAHAQRALLQSHGHKIQLLESTDKVCRMRGRRKDEGDDDWQEVEWDLARADKLGLLGKAEWKKQPKTMLVARATGELCRLVASDVLHAMPYNAEELHDSIEAPEQTRVTGAEILAQVRPAAALTAVPETPEPVPPRNEVADLFAAAGLDTDEDRAQYVNEVVGREVNGLGDLRPAEMLLLLTRLRAFAAQSQPGGAA